MKTIKVNGSYKEDFKVDYIYVYLNVEKQFNEYDACVKDSELVSNRVYELITKAGFDKKELRLTNFDLYPVNESVKKEDRYVIKQVGYKYHQSYTLGLDFDLKRLGSLLETLEQSNDDISFTLSFALKDSSKAKDKVLKKAIKECEKKANFIAKQTGLKITGINNIEYSARNNNFARVANYAMSVAETNFEPEDISVQDSITIIYDVE